MITMPTATAAKVASILVHVDEGLSTDGHEFDWGATRALLQDPDVLAWLTVLRDMALVPVKRK